MITIALDYDDTYTLNPTMWSHILESFAIFNCKVYIVTYRHSTSFDDMDLDIDGIHDYVFTGGQSKQKYCEDNGINIDIWIDDSPEAIVYDFKDLPIR